jgi:hypothetical protein
MSADDTEPEPLDEVEDAGVDEGAGEEVEEGVGFGIGDEMGPGVEVGDEVGASDFDTGPVIPFEGTAEDVVGFIALSGAGEV